MLTLMPTGDLAHCRAVCGFVECTRKWFVTLSLIIAVLAAWWLVTVALATGAFKVRRHHPHHHHEEGENHFG